MNLVYNLVDFFLMNKNEKKFLTILKKRKKKLFLMLVFLKVNLQKK